MLGRVLRVYTAALLLPFVFALRCDQILYPILIVGAISAWVSGHETAGTIFCAFAVVVSTLALGASLERAGAIKR